jgi:predicted butyrate kinase (DUF1464 family)
MLRVLGVDPGTVSLDGCVLEDGRVASAWSLPTAEALSDPERLLSRLTEAGSLDLIAGPSGYGLPMIRGEFLKPEHLKLAVLPDPESGGGLGGLSRLMRLLASSGLPVVFTPGVIHLPTVPSHRKLNRIDMGTADKVAAAALAIADQAARSRRPPTETSFILLELGGAFSAAVAISQGRIVDGIGGTGGPIGWRSAGSWDGEVACLAGRVTKAALFQGGVESGLKAGRNRAEVLSAYVEGAEKAVRQLMASVPDPGEILLSGRRSEESEVETELTARLARLAPVRRLTGSTAQAKPGAEGAAILADGLAGGRHRAVTDGLQLAAASGTVLDHLVAIDRLSALQRLELA